MTLLLRPANSRRVRNSIDRTGAVLVPVLVIVLVIAMLCGQTYRTIMFSVRADRERAAARQLRELIELGRIRMTQQSASNAAYKGEQLRVPVGKPSDDEAATWAVIEIEINAPSETSSNAAEAGRGRIVVRYPVNEPHERTAVWEINE